MEVETEVNNKNLGALLNQKDYTRVVELIEFQKGDKPDKLDYLVYCYFKLRRYAESLKACTDAYAKTKDPKYHTYKAILQYYMGDYKQSLATLKNAEASPLKNSTRFLLAQALDDEATLQNCSILGDTIEDNLTLALINYQRGQYPEAILLMKKILDVDGASNEKYLSLNYYIALCFHAAGNHEEALEYLSNYLKTNPESPLANNLKACCLYKLNLLDDAMDTLEPFANKGVDVIDHNLLMLRGEPDGPKGMSAYFEKIPEARVNFAINAMKNGNYDAAKSAIQDCSGMQAETQLILAAIFLWEGYQREEDSGIAVAREYYEIVGTDASFVDLQYSKFALANSLLLAGVYEEAILYYESVEEDLRDLNFHYNYGVAQSAVGMYEEAFQTFEKFGLDIEKIECDFWYLRCAIRSGRGQLAWQIYVRNSKCDFVKELLSFIGNECFCVSAFAYSLKAFISLANLDNESEYLSAIQASAAGLIKSYLAGGENRETVESALESLFIQSRKELQNLAANLKRAVEIYD